MVRITEGLTVVKGSAPIADIKRLSQITRSQRLSGVQKGAQVSASRSAVFFADTLPVFRRSQGEQASESSQLHATVMTGLTDLVDAD